VYSLQFLGGGRMAEALLGGLLAGGTDPSDVAVVEVVAARRDDLAGRFGGVTVLERPAAAAGVVVATKPGDVTSALRDAHRAGLQRVLSIAAGVSTRALQSCVDPATPVVRAMPNTPALVGAGAAAISGGVAATDDDLAWAEGLLGSVGTVTRVPERLLDAVTGLSGSGPAYVFLVAEAMIDAGVLAGLPRDTADQLVRQTILGAATLLAGSTEGPEALRAAVTSPAGTTAAGLRVLEDRAVRAAFLDAVQAAAERSAELDS
jgi:pyrroline-5-carboxylate reductase